MDSQTRVLTACVALLAVLVAVILVYRPSFEFGTPLSPERPTGGPDSLPLGGADSTLPPADTMEAVDTRRRWREARRPITPSEIQRFDPSLSVYDLLARERGYWLELSTQPGVSVNGQFLGPIESLSAVRVGTVERIAFQFSRDNPHWMVIVTLRSPADDMPR